MIDDGLSRRGFIQLSGVAGLSALGGDARAQLDDPTDPTDEPEMYGLLLGPEGARPEPNGQYLSQWDTYRFAYFATDTGAKYRITNRLNDWDHMPTEFNGPTTQVDEVRTENFTSFFNHTFARPEAPDDKNWDYTSTDVSKFESEIELASTTSITSRQRGNYPPGSEAVPGVAFRLTGQPSGGEAFAGYFTANNGMIAGEDAADSFVELRKGGNTHRVYRSNWNEYVPDSRVWVDNRPIVTRFPHLFYGGGDIEVKAIIHEEGNSELRCLHRFTPDNVAFSKTGPPFDQPNLPVRFESSGLSGGNLRANAAHYEFGEVETENRVNGEHFTNVDAGTSGWTPLLIWQKRSGWEMVNVQPMKIAVSAETNDAKLGLQLNPGLSSVTTSLPTNASSDETAVEIVSASFDAPGERRWLGYSPSGQGSNPGGVNSDELDFNLPSNQPVALVAQGVGGTATLSGAIAWEEFF